MDAVYSTERNATFIIPAMLLISALTLGIVSVLAAKPVQNAPDVPSQIMELDPQQVSAGKSQFMVVCAACHGPKATGIDGLGKPLVGSSFVNSLTDSELLMFLQIGRKVDDPLNTTGVVMPARGGRPYLTDADLLNIILYIRSLNQE